MQISLYLWSVSLQWENVFFRERKLFSFFLCRSVTRSTSQKITSEFSYRIEFLYVERLECKCRNQSLATENISDHKLQKFLHVFRYQKAKFLVKFLIVLRTKLLRKHKIVYVKTKRRNSKRKKSRVVSFVKKIFQLNDSVKWTIWNSLQYFIFIIHLSFFILFHILILFHISVLFIFYFILLLSCLYIY